MAVFFLDNNQEVIKIVPDDGAISIIQTQELPESDGLLKDTLYVRLKNDQRLFDAQYMAVKSYGDDRNAFDLYRIVNEIVPDNATEFEGVQLAPYELEGAVVEDLRPQYRPLDRTMNQLLENTDWRLGYMDDNLPTVSTNFYYVSVKDALKQLQDLLNIEFLFKVEISGNEITDKWIEVYREVGNRTLKRFNYGTNALTVKRETSSSELYTALIGRGKGEEVSSAEDNPGGQAGYGRKINFEDVEWSIENGNPVDKPKGQKYIELPQATEEYGIKLIDGRKVPRVGIVEFPDTEEPEVLINQTWQELQYYARPRVLFSTTVAKIGGTSIGDTVTIHRHDLNMHYMTRVRKVVRNRKNDKQTQLEIGDVVHTPSTKRQSSINSKLNNIASDLNNVRNEVTNYVISTDGENVITFSNEEPERKRVNDSWVRDHPSLAGETQWLVWDGEAWELIMDTSDTTKNARAIEEQQKEIESAQARADEAVSEINTAVEKAGFTSLDETILDIQAVSNSATSQAVEAWNTASEALIDAKNALNDLNNKLNVSDYNVDIENIELGIQSAKDRADEAFGNASTALDRLDGKLDVGAYDTEIADLNVFLEEVQGTAQSAVEDALSAIESANSAKDSADSLSTEVSGLKTDVAGFESTVNDFEGRVTQFSADVAGFTSTVAQYETEVDEFGAIVSTNTTQVNELKNDINGFESLLASYNEDLEGFDTTVSTFRNTLEGLESTVANYGAEVDEYGNAVNTYATELSTLKNTVDGFEATVGNFEESVTGYQTSLSTLTNTVEGFETTVANYETTVDEYGNEVATYATELATLENTVNGFNSLVASFEEEATGYALEVSQFRNTLEGLESSITSYEVQLDEYGNAVDGYATQVSSFSNTLSGLQSSVATYEQTVSGYTSEVAQLRNTVEGFESIVANYETAVDQYGNEVNRYATQVSTLNNTVNGFESTVTEVRSDFENMEIGGRNLLLDSAGMHYLDSEDRTYYYDISPYFTLDRFKSAKAITLSFDIETEDIVMDSGWIVLELIVNDEGGNLHFIQNVYRQNGSNMLRKSITLYLEDLSYEIAELLHVSMYVKNYTGKVGIGNPQITIGNKATDWTPAPEDMATQSQVSTLSNTVDGLNSTIARYEVELDEYGNVVNQYATQVSQFENTLDGLTSTVGTYEQTVSGYTSQVANLQNTVYGFNTTVANYETQVDQYGDAVSEYATEVSQFENTLAGLSNTVAEYAVEVDEYGNVVEHYATQVSDFRNTVDGLNSTVTGFEQEVSGYTTQVATLQNTINGFNSTVQRVEADYDNLSGTVSTHTTELSNMDGRISAKAEQSTVDTLAGTVSSLGTDVGVVAGQINQRVWNTDIETAIDGIEVGGRNLLLGTTKEFNTVHVGIYSGSLIDSGVTSKHIYTLDELGVKAGDTLTVSMYVGESVEGYGGGFRIDDQHGQNRYSSYKYVKNDYVYETFTILEESTEIRIYTLGFYYNPEASDIYSLPVKELKLEKGNKATDWTPAPEDTDAKIEHIETEWTQTFDSFSQTVSSIDGRVTQQRQDIDGLTTTVQSVRTDLTGATTLLNQTVSTVDTHTQNIATLRTDVNGKATVAQFNTLTSTVNGTITRVGNAEGKITQIETTVNGLQTTVASKASQSEVTQLANGLQSVVTDLDDLEVGGRNLITGTEKEIIYVDTSGWGDYIAGGTNSTRLLEDGSVKKGETYTLRVFIDATQSEYPINAFIRIPSATNSHRDYSTSKIAAGEEGYVTTTFDIPEDATSVSVYVVRFSQNNTPTQRVGYGELKLEKGNIATDWTPAPEDTESRITQLSDNINLRVAKNDVINQINISNENILIQSENILLDGDVTVRGTAWMDGAVIKNASIDGAKIQDATIGSAKIANLDVAKVSGLTSNFVQSYWNSATGGSVRATGDGIVSTASDGSQTLIQNGVTLTRQPNGSGIGTIGYVPDGTGSPVYRIQTSWGAHFALSQRFLDTYTGYVQEKDSLKISTYDGGTTEVTLRASSTYITGSVDINKLNVRENISMFNNDINKVGTLYFNYGSWMYDDHRNSNLQIVAGNKLRLYVLGASSVGGAGGNEVLAFDNTYGYMYRNLSMEGNNVTNQSDARLKTDISTRQESSLEKINRFNFVDFTWIKDDKSDFGVIAQQVQQVAPELILGGEDGYLNLNNSLMNMMTSHGLQELSQKHDTVAQTVDSHTDTIHRLQQELSEANRRIAGQQAVIEVLKEKII